MKRARAKHLFLGWYMNWSASHWHPCPGSKSERSLNFSLGSLIIISIFGNFFMYLLKTSSEITKKKGEREKKKQTRK